MTPGGGTMRFLLILLLLSLSAPSFAAEPPLRVAVDAQYPPFGYREKAGNLAGFDVDIAVALCSEMRRECLIKGMDFDDILPALIRGEIDIAVAGMGNTPERARQINFTDRYYRSHSFFIKAEGTKMNISPEGLAGKSVGVQAGSAQEEYVKRTFPRAVLVPTPSFVDMMNDLKNGKVSLAISEGLPAFAYLKTAEGAGLETVGTPIQDSLLTGPSYIVVSKKLPQLVPTLNRALDTIRRSGEYARINRKYFDFNIY